MKKQIRKNCWRALLMLISMSLISLSLYAQSKKINGTVLDEKGYPLIGATVKLKSGKLATLTDLNGKFSLNVSDNETSLLVTYIGYTDQVVPITEQSSNLHIKLVPGSHSLNDVVVVGYGTQRKRDITGATGSISAATLQQVPATNVVNQLQGRLAGVDIQNNSGQPGAVGQIRIRGERSLGASGTQNNNQNSPLIVLDGVPFFGGSINDINPDDIASIDVLKDASATAIYGSRGASGVIIVTTKRGKAGKTIVNYNAYAGVSNPTSEYNFMNGQEYAAFKETARVLNSVNPGTSNYNLTAAEQTGLTNGTNTDWQKIIFRQGFTNDQSLNISGGTENTQFSFGTGYRHEKGIVYGQDYTRYTMRATLDHQVSKFLKVGGSTIANLAVTNGSNRYPVGGVVRLSPLVSPYNADGSVNLLPQAGSLDASVVNPLTIRDNSTNTDQNRRLSSINTLYTEINIIDGLKYRANLGFSYYSSGGGMYSGPNTFYNTNTSYAQSSENVNASENYSYTIDNILTYDKVFAQKHHLTFTGVYSVEKDHYQNNGFAGVGIPVDYIQNYNLAQANSISANTGGFSENGLISYMARLNYVFNGKYSVTATIRDDGSSVFPNKKYYVYPAFAAAWNIDREDFFKGASDVVSALKIRGGYGKTSSQSVGAYSSSGPLSSNFYNYGSTGANGYYLATLANQNLTWEFTNSINIGLDFGLFKDRITGSVDVYEQKTDKILQQVNLPYSNGATSYYANIGKTQGKGLEITLSSQNLKSQDGLNWTTDFNISFNRNTIVALHDGLTQDIGNNWFVGQPFNVIYDVKKIGIWQTSEAAQAAVYGQLPGQIKVQDVNNDGKINTSDLQIIGNFQPKYTGGITNTFFYKNFDLNFVANYRIGQTVIVPYLTADGSAQGYPFFGNGRVNQWKVNYWTPTNPTNDFPAPDAANDKQIYASTLAYRDGSFVKMRSINLGYTIPSKLLKRAGISSLRVYATCYNPFIIYSPLVKSGLAVDPEGNATGGIVISTVNPSYPTAGGGSAGTTGSRAITVNLNNPPTRTFQLGVSVKL
ncbi:SusC/RagA family TonB-linked outer membrane protein [Mucilaginibacter sp. SP1R1]|uniref:SusC/RagA family TonB-linked outer membrane protein n=1 Tax=Mucilaginibacter sp. SP1R1 TaxID=2723091 RepID=UPI00160B75F2|nr:TonB-dependent receptor [Mucilaginibacter sp. SP1R1]MBB6149118.1 TonB-linked SusC/RagA family outer membrane protein [Mucilaginibacter sp. SP1R1]